MITDCLNDGFVNGDAVLGGGFACVWLEGEASARAGLVLAVDQAEVDAFRVDSHELRELIFTCVVVHVLTFAPLGVALNCDGDASGCGEGGRDAAEIVLTATVVAADGDDGAKTCVGKCA